MPISSVLWPFKCGKLWGAGWGGIVSVFIFVCVYWLSTLAIHSSNARCQPCCSNIKTHFNWAERRHLVISITETSSPGIVSWSHSNSQWESGNARKYFPVRSVLAWSRYCGAAADGRTCSLLWRQLINAKSYANTTFCHEAMKFCENHVWWIKFGCRGRWGNFQNLSNWRD